MDYAWLKFKHEATYIFRISLQRWLERTPGLDEPQFGFWKKFEEAVRKWIHECWFLPAEVTCPSVSQKLQACQKFNTRFTIKCLIESSSLPIVTFFSAVFDSN